MNANLRQRAVVYLLAVALPFLMLAIRQQLPSSFGHHPLLVLFVPPLILVAALGGLWPGMLSTVVAGVLSAVYLFPPHGEMMFRSAADVAQWSLLLVSGAMASVLAEWLARALRQTRAAAAQFRASETRLRAIVEGSADAVFIKDHAGRYTMVNQPAARLMGKTVDALIGRDDFAVFSAADAKRVVAMDREILAGGEVRSLKEHATTPDGVLRTFETTKGPLFDEQGNTIGLFGIARDVTDQRSFEEALKQQTRRLNDILEGTNVGTWEWNVRTGETVFNERWAEMVGYTLAELAPVTIETWARLVHPEDNLKSHQRLLSHFNGETAYYECDARMRHKDGHWVWVLDRGRVSSWDDEGRPLWMSGTHVDISQRKAEEAELARYRDQLEVLVEQRTRDLTDTQFAMNKAGIGIHWVDLHSGRFLHVNEQAARMIGYTVEEMLQLRVADVDPNFPAGDFKATTDLLFASGTAQFESVLRARDGHFVPVEVVGYVAPSRADLGARFITFVTDISARRAQEQALRDARRTAEAASVAKSEFLANMSHEIRTPLNGVLGLAQIGYREFPDGRAHETFGRILESGKLLLTIVNDILDFSKIEAGKLDVESIAYSPSALVTEAIAALRLSAEVKDLALRCEVGGVPDAVLGDPVRVQQVLLNLLSNAVKFTDHGSVCLRAWREGEHLVYEVADSGIGIDDGQMARLFQPFEQADSSTTRKYGGTGLGLAISRRLATLMGGELQAASTRGQGSRFQLRLPCHETAAASGGAWAPAAGGGEGRLAGLRLLVADDNDINRIVLEDMLSREGATLRLVEDGRAAVAAVAAGEAFDLVLMDVQMPEMDGLEATRQILQRRPELPVVGQTAHALKEEHARCAAAGMVATLTKPINSDELVRVVRQFAGRRDAANAKPATPAGAALTEPDESSTLEQLAVVDWDALHERYAGRNEFVARLFATGIATHGQDAAALRAMAADAERARIAAIARPLQRFAGVIHARQLSVATDRVLEAVDDEGRDIASPTQALADALDRLIAALANASS